MNSHETATVTAYGSTRAPDATVVSDSRASDSNYTYVGVENVPLKDEFLDIESVLRTFCPDPVAKAADSSVPQHLVELRSLESSALRLRRSLQLLARMKDDEFVVELPQLELYAFGETVSEATDELVEEVVDLYQTLHASPSTSLSRKTLSWKLFLDQYITPVDGK